MCFFTVKVRPGWEYENFKNFYFAKSNFEIFSNGFWHMIEKFQGRGLLESLF